MKAIELINALRTELAALKANGDTVVAISGLEAYLAAAAAGANDASAEHALARARDEFEVFKVQAPLEHASALEVWRSVITAGGEALRTLVLINGGAAVALLAFLGNVVTKDLSNHMKYSTSNMKTALVTFVFGVGFAGIASAGRYLTQFATVVKQHTAAGWFTAVSIVFGLLSLAAFFRGGLWAYWAF